MITTIGVLALQGSVIEHMKMLQRLPNVKSMEVKNIEDIKKIDGIIFPGGESTTIGKLLKDFELFGPIKKRIEEGLPVWGTCAGLILLAKNIVGETPHLGVIDITVRRNAYGRQIDSFTESKVINEISDKPFPLVFIRAPWIESVGEGVKTLLEIGGHIVAAQAENKLVTSFHPELTEDLTFHKYFAKLCTKYAHSK